MGNLLVVAFALWFFLRALEVFLAFTKVADPLRTILLFLYAFIAGAWLLWENGSIGTHFVR